LWLKRHALSGSYKALPNRREITTKLSAGRHFVRKVQLHGDKTQAVQDSIVAGRYQATYNFESFRQNRIYPKKTFGYKDTYEQKWAEFLEEISGIYPEDIVYWW